MGNLLIIITYNSKWSMWRLGNDDFNAMRHDRRLLHRVTPNGPTNRNFSDSSIKGNKERWNGSGFRAEGMGGYRLLLISSVLVW